MTKSSTIAIDPRIMLAMFMPPFLLTKACACAILWGRAFALSRLFKQFADRREQHQQRREQVQDRRKQDDGFECFALLAVSFVPGFLLCLDSMRIIA